MKRKSEFPPKRQKRTPGRPAGIPWQAVARLAEAGCVQDEIMAELGLDEGVLREPAVILRLRQTIAAAHARLKVKLRQQILRISSRGTRGKSVHATLALLRNVLLWDAPGRQAAVDKHPDREGAVAEIEAVISRMTRSWPRCPACGAKTRPSRAAVMPPGERD